MQESGGVEGGVVVVGDIEGGVVKKGLACTVGRGTTGDTPSVGAEAVARESLQEVSMPAYLSIFA